MRFPGYLEPKHLCLQPPKTPVSEKPLRVFFGERTSEHVISRVFHLHRWAEEANPWASRKGNLTSESPSGTQGPGPLPKGITLLTTTEEVTSASGMREAAVRPVRNPRVPYWKLYLRMNT